MLDLTQEVSRAQLVPLATITTTTTSTSVDLRNRNSGDLMALTLNIKNIGGTSPSYTVKIQDSADNSTFADVATTSLMAATAFPAQTANLANPLVLPIDPRAVRRYVRAVTTVSGTTPTADVNLDLLYRPLQAGFPTTSG